MKQLAFPLLALASLLTAGCGGGSSSGDASTAPIFISDDLNTNYDHVWVTIKSLTLVRQGGARVTLFGAGAEAKTRVVDLRSLRDTEGALFSLLGKARVPKGTYTGIEVVMDDDVVVHEVGASDSVAATFAGSTGGEKVNLSSLNVMIDLEKSNARTVVDFDLSGWSLVGSTVTLPADALRVRVEVLKSNRMKGREAGSGMATGRRAYTGGRFAIDVDGVRVVYDAATVFYNADGSSSPTVPAGAQVSYYGTYDPTTLDFLADTVVVAQAIEGNPLYTGSGTVASNPIFTGNEFVVNPTTTGFLPSSPAIQVHCTDRTRFSILGVPSTMKTSFAVMTGSSVELQGVYDAATNVYEASSVNVSLVPKHTLDNSSGPVVLGSFSKAKKDGLNSVTVSTWYGGLFTRGVKLPLVVTSQTVYVVDGETVSQEAFSAACRDGDDIKVELKKGPNGLQPTKIVHRDLAI